MEKLYLKHRKKEDEDTIDDFTTRLFFIKDDSASISQLPSTYTDKECENIQCGGAYRSICETLRIYKTAFPTVKDETVLDSIKRIIFEHPELKVRASILFCPDIEKWVIHSKFPYDTDYDSKYLMCTNYRNSDLYYNRRGKGELSLKDILNLMGFEDHLV